MGGVMLLMAICSLGSGFMMFGLSGRLRRSEAEKIMDEDPVAASLKELDSFAEGNEDDSDFRHRNSDVADGDSKNHMSVHRKLLLRLRHTCSRWAMALIKAWPDTSMLGGLDPAEEWTDSSLWGIPSSGL